MGWHKTRHIYSNLDLLSEIKSSCKEIFLDSSIEKDHIWILYKGNNDIVTATCYLTEGRGGDFEYKPIEIEQGPVYKDMPIEWLEKITDVEERKKIYPESEFSILKDWLNSYRFKNGIEIKEYENEDDGRVTYYQGKIKNLSYLIATDPHYDKNVSCRYERKFKNSKDWNVDFRITRRNYYDEYRGHKLNIKGYAINILLTSSDKSKSTYGIKQQENGNIAYSKVLKCRDYDIGMDTAQVASGINDKAREISNYSEAEDKTILGLDDYRPYFSIETLTDGSFGSVSEFSYSNEFYGINIFGWLDDDTGYSEVEIKNYFEDRLEIQNLKEIVKKEDKELEY